jgi:hypothetical protein
MIKLIAGATALASAVVLGALAGTAASGATLVANCQSRNLKPVYGGTDGAAGTLHDRWRIVNTGGGSCGVGGFPTVVNYRADGRPFVTSVTQTGTFGPVILSAGQHASFVLSYPQPGNVGCTPQHAVRMTIQVPNTAQPLIASRGERACAGTLQESPLVHGG